MEKPKAMAARMGRAGTLACRAAAAGTRRAPRLGAASSLALHLPSPLTFHGGGEAT